MIHALRYEPPGQRQRFEPREQQRSDLEQRQIHLHLSLHLYLDHDARARAGEPGASLLAAAGTVGSPGACRSHGWQASASNELLAAFCQLYQSLARYRARTMEFCSGASMSVTVTALFLPQSQATTPSATVVSSLGPPALSGNPWTGGVPLRRSLKFAPLGLAPIQ